MRSSVFKALSSAGCMMPDIFRSQTVSVMVMSIISDVLTSVVELTIRHNKKYTSQYHCLHKVYTPIATSTII